MEIRTTAPQDQTMTLQHINVPRAQTWNYLKINDATLEVPSPQSHGKVYARLPQLFSRIDCGVGDEALSWIEASAKDAHYIEVPAHTQRKEPIVITTDTDAIQDVGVMVREGAHATVVIVASDNKSTQPQLTSSLVRIFAEEHAQVQIIEIIACGEAHQHLEALGVHAEAHAAITMKNYALGAKKALLSSAIDLAGTKSRLDLRARYYVDADELLDINQLCTQSGTYSHAEMHTQGVLADHAHKTLRKTIDLVHGAKGAKGNESETVLVLGDDIVNKTLPTILCDEEDVQGNHGATIGSVSQDQLAYLADRGLDTTAANALFTRALFDDALIHAQTKAARAAIVTRAEQVLGREAAFDLLDGMGSALTEEI